MKHLFFLCFILIFSDQSWSGTKVAKATLLRGEVELLTLGKTSKLKKDDWVEDGAVVKTAEKSFVKLMFVDKSSMNIGPNSEMRIENFTGKDAGVIDLVKGKIRSQVTKDYLQMDKDKSKLFIKTQNAVMGIRGTDFMISTNGVNTTAVLFEGDVKFNNATRDEMASGKLEDIVDRGVPIYPGEFSVVERDRPNPTVPSILNLEQRESLEKNKEFGTERAPDSTTSTDDKKTVVPGGLSGQAVSNNVDILKKEITQAGGDSASKASPTSQEKPEGYVKGDQIKPANGSFVHIDSGVIIPPGPGSVLDPNTNTYIPGAGQGKIASDGSYIPPKNVEITNDGKVMVAVTDKNGDVKVQEVQKPSPVVTAGGSTLTDIGRAIAQNPGLIQPGTAPAANDILNKSFVPSGLNDLSNFQRNQTGGINNVNEAPAAVQKPTVDTTIIVKPQ